MHNNAKTMKTVQKEPTSSKPKHYTLKRTPHNSKPIEKKTSLISKDKTTASNKNALPDISSHRYPSSKKITTKIEIEVKEKEEPLTVKEVKETQDNSDKPNEKLIELESELKKLTEESSVIRNQIALSEKKNINLLRDIENMENFISMKNHRLGKLKKDNVELKAKLADLNDKHKEGIDSSRDENTQSQIDEFFFRLIASCQYARDEEEEGSPLAKDIFDQLPVATYNNLHYSTKTCLLCNFELCNNDIIMLIPTCSHIFHNACLVNHFQRKNFCPSCKEEVKDI